MTSINASQRLDYTSLLSIIYYFMACEQLADVSNLFYW